jgi:hypothetical protein
VELLSDRMTRSIRRRVRNMVHGRRTRRIVAGVAVVVAAFGAGCSSSPSTGTVASLPGRGSVSATTAPLTVSEHDSRLVAWAQCMRHHGVGEPDPYQRSGYVGLSVRIPPPGPASDRADAACGHVLQSLISAKQRGARNEVAAWLPALKRYAQCMRAHNIAMDDPTMAGQLKLGTVAGINSDVGRYSPQFRAADAACRRLLPSGVHDDGSGP